MESQYRHSPHLTTGTASTVGQALIVPRTAPVWKTSSSHGGKAVKRLSASIILMSVTALPTHQSRITDLHLSHCGVLCSEKCPQTLHRYMGPPLNLELFHVPYFGFDSSTVGAHWITARIPVICQRDPGPVMSFGMGNSSSNASASINRIFHPPISPELSWKAPGLLRQYHRSAPQSYGIGSLRQQGQEAPYLPGDRLPTVCR